MKDPKDAHRITFQKWNDSEYGEEIVDVYDWRSEVLGALREGDVEEMYKKAAPLAEWNVIKLATTAESEPVRLQANLALLGQAGHGPMQKVQHSMDYTVMEENELIPIVSGLIRRLIATGVDIKKLTAGVVIEGEIISSEDLSSIISEEKVEFEK